MANSIITATGDGVTVQYALNFTLGILNRDYVTCQVNNEVDGLDDPVYRTLEWVTDGLVNIQGGTPANGVPIVFKRTMPKDSLIHDYSNGVPITEANLDESNLQTIMSIHEFLDGRLEQQFVQDLDMGGYKITNLAAGTDPTDAVTLAQVGDASLVADNIDEVVLVGENIADVVTVADDIADVNTVATNLDSILNAADAFGAIAYRWAFDSSTSMADPGTGDIRLNNATVASATAIAISANSTDSGNPDLAGYIATWDDSTSDDKGKLIVRNADAPGTFAVFNVTAVTNNTTWFQLTVTVDDNSGIFTAADLLYAAFIPTGDKGAAGSGDVSSNFSSGVDGEAVVQSGTGGKTLKRSTLTATVVKSVSGVQAAAGSEEVNIHANDLPIEPSANSTAVGNTSNDLAAGASVTAFQCCYLGSAGKWLLTDADAESTSKGLLAISLESKADTEAMRVALPSSIIRNDSWTWATVGAPIYLGTTAGAITLTAPSGTDDVVRIVGYVLTDDCIFFQPSNNYITLN